MENVLDLLEDCPGQAAGLLVEAAVLVLLHRFGGGDFYGIHVAPGVASEDHFGLVESVDALGQDVVVGPDRTDRGPDAGIADASGVG